MHSLPASVLPSPLTAAKCPRSTVSPLLTHEGLARLTPTRAPGGWGQTCAERPHWTGSAPRAGTSLLPLRPGSPPTPSSADDPAQGDRVPLTVQMSAWSSLLPLWPVGGPGPALQLPPDRLHFLGEPLRAQPRGWDPHSSQELSVDWKPTNQGASLWAGPDHTALHTRQS